MIFKNKKKQIIILLYCLSNFCITKIFNKNLCSKKQSHINNKIEKKYSIPQEFIDQVNRMNSLISQLPPNSIAITNAITYLKNNCDQIQIQLDQERKIIEQKHAELIRIEEQKAALEKAHKELKKQLQEDTHELSYLNIVEVKNIEELNSIINNKNGILLFLHYQSPENPKFSDQLNSLNQSISSPEFKNFLQLNENIILIKVNSLMSKQVADLLVNGDSHQIDPWTIHPAIGIRVIQKGKIVGKYKPVGDSNGTDPKTIINRIKKYIENIRKNFNSQESIFNLIIENINNLNNLNQILAQIQNGYLITCIYKNPNNKSIELSNIKNNINNAIFNNFIKEYSQKSIIKIISLNIYYQDQKSIADTILLANSDIDGMHPIIFIRKIENNNLIGCPQIIGNQNNCNSTMDTVLLTKFALKNWR